MRITTRFKAAAIAVALLPAVAASVSESARGAEKAADSAAPKVPEGWMLVEEDVWYQLADEPDRHFQEARLNYLHRDYEAAAADIRKAAAMLKLAVAISPGAEKKPLEASILELETLAAEAQHGKVHSARTLDRIFARAYLALAIYNEAAARRHVHAEEPEKAGHHLRAAAVDIEQSLLWGGEVIDDELMHNLIDAEAVAGKLLKGVDTIFKKAIDTLDALHSEFKQMQEMMKAAG